MHLPFRPPKKFIFLRNHRFGFFNPYTPLLSKRQLTFALLQMGPTHHLLSHLPASPPVVERHLVGPALLLPASAAKRFSPAQLSTPSGTSAWPPPAPPSPSCPAAPRRCPRAGGCESRSARPAPRSHAAASVTPPPPAPSRRTRWWPTLPLRRRTDGADARSRSMAGRRACCRALRADDGVGQPAAQPP